MPAKPNEIQITRVYDAPVKLVWEAWTDPAQAAHWWGPRGFTITTKSKDLRPGGHWVYTMHGPDGTDYPNVTTYHEVEKYKKLVYDHGANEKQSKLFTVTVLFSEHKNKTTMVMTMTVDTVAQANELKKMIKKAQGNSTWDRLGEFLLERETGHDPFIINRVFEADPTTVFNFWTDPEQLVKWLGPADSGMTMHQAAIQAGGTAQWSMKMGGGELKYGQIHYQKIASPTELLYVQNFCDQNGRLSKPFFSNTYPDRLRTTVHFTEEDGGQTRVTVRWDIEGPASDSERETFRSMKPAMTTGWNESFDKLDEMIPKR